MHLFGFLGMSNYVPCAYLAPWQEEHSPPVTYVQTASALALQERAPIEEISILCTVESRDKHARGLRQEFEAYDLEVTRVVEVPSELGRQGVLELFDRLADILPGDSKRLAFDMTHGFRAQPAVAMLFLNYLQAVDPEVEIAHLLYGAFERGQRQAPLVDLIDLWALRDWGYGFLSFHRTGDTSELHTMTQRAQDDYCRSGHVPRVAGHIPELGSFAGRLKELHHHASLNRVPGLFGEDGLLQAMHNEVARDWNPISEEVGRFVAPLREQLREQLEVFLVDEWHSLEGLGAQLRWIDWLRQHGSYQEALTIAREWSITLLARGISGRESPEARANAENLHGELVSAKKPDDYSPLLVRLLKLFGEEFGKDANRITSRCVIRLTTRLCLWEAMTSHRQGQPGASAGEHPGQLRRRARCDTRALPGGHSAVHLGGAVPGSALHGGQGARAGCRGGSDLGGRPGGSRGRARAPDRGGLRARGAPGDRGGPVHRVRGGTPDGPGAAHPRSSEQRPQHRRWDHRDAACAESPAARSRGVWTHGSTGRGHRPPRSRHPAR